MEVFVKLLGAKGIVIVSGFLIFLIAFRYSVNIFEWIEKQTLGTRTYIMEKLELLFIEIPPEKVTYLLLFCSFGSGAFVLCLFGLMGAWIPGLVLAGIVTFLGFKIPKPFIDGMIERRIKAFEGQMVDAMQLLSNGIRAGLSLPQAIGMVVDEMPQPISQEFNMILQQNRIGVPLEECFEGLVKRVPTEDNEMFVASVNILRETGGNLAEVFDTIVDVIRERVRLKQKIDTYVAQGMFQGATIFAMPWAICGIFTLNDPEMMMPMFTHPLGWAALTLALLFDLAGGYVILKIVKIKV
jgi:tight adherence protein B